LRASRDKLDGGEDRSRKIPPACITEALPPNNARAARRSDGLEPVFYGDVFMGSPPVIGDETL